MNPMNESQVEEFLAYLKDRIEWHYKKMAGCLSHHRVLIKTERAEAEAILAVFLNILDKRSM